MGEAQVVPSFSSHRCRSPFRHRITHPHPHELKLTSTLAAVPDDEPCLESGLLWIVLDVASKVLQLRFTAHDVIEGLPQPECAATAKKLVDVVRAAAFPMTDDLTESDFVRWLDERMDVIWHDAPSIELVGGSVTS